MSPKLIIRQVRRNLVIKCDGMYGFGSKAPCSDPLRLALLEVNELIRSDITFQTRFVNLKVKLDSCQVVVESCRQWVWARGGGPLPAHPATAKNSLASPEQCVSQGLLKNHRSTVPRTKPIPSSRL